jgi:HEPN domain-containing protein
VGSLLDGAEFDRWHAQAQSAVETAALASAGGRHEWACFLSEQAAQLFVKGLLHGIGREAWGHDLVALCARAKQAVGEGWPDSVAEAAARLSRHYIPTRSPDAHASGPPSTHYTESDSRQAAADASRIADAVAGAWSHVEASA